MLLDETGFPLVIHTAARGRDAMSSSNGLISRVIIATDTPEIASVAEKQGFDAVMTRKNHRSGTDRLAEAISHFPEEFVVNLQGDEPEMPPGVLLSVAQALAAGPAPLVTAAVPIPREEMANPSVVKVVCDMFSNALYFSRAPIPYCREDRDADKALPMAHFGIYGYTRKLLVEFPRWPEGTLEHVEALEQLRFLERGFKMRVIEVSERTKGIDTPEDYKAFVKRYRESGRKDP